MPKRFIDTEIWKKSWFRKLSPTIKLFIIYLFTNCDHAGLLDVDIEAAEFHIGGKIDLDQVPEGWIIQVRKDKWFLPKFIEFQYPKGLNRNMKMHQSVAKLLEKHNLVNYLNAQKESTPTHTGKVPLQDKDKGKDKEKEKNKDLEKNPTKKQKEEFDIKVIELMKYFGFTLKDNKDKNIQAKQFLLSLQQQNKKDYFSKQFDAYKKYKKDTKGIVHGFNNFLGTDCKKYLDGAWNQDNWQNKLLTLIKADENKITQEMTTYKFRENEK